MPLGKVTHIAQTKSWHGEVPVYGRYSFGIAGDRFFREIKDNARIMGTRCTKCNLIYVPPRIYCERCFSALEEWLEVPNRAIVYTFTVSYVDLDGNRLPEPLVVAMVKFDGVLGGLVHCMGEVPPEGVRIGMPVKVEFKPKAQRIGSITDIKYFKPLS